MKDERTKIFAVEVDRIGLDSSSNAAVEQKIAIADLVEDNSVELIDREAGPYKLSMIIEGSKLGFHFANRNGVPIVSHILSFTPFRRVMRDYQTLCEVHFQAARQSDPYRLEAIDMARRALHDEGSDILKERMASKIRIDRPTARRLFTLIMTTQLSGVSSGLSWFGASRAF